VQIVGLVITTRDSGLAAGSAGQEIFMSGVAPAEAVQIITSQLNPSQLDTDVHDQLIGLVEHLGGSPLAVEWPAPSYGDA